MIRAVLFDWGNTLMVDDGRTPGAMCGWARVRSCPHAAWVLRALSDRYLIALATNADDSFEPEIRSALKRVHLNGWVRLVFCSNGIGARKPSPKFYRHILDALELAPEEVVMVGDGLENDVLGALQAGLRSVWYRPGPEPEALPVGAAWVGDLRGLPGVLARMA